MKADFNSLKKELKRLADTQYLKRELNRVANEIKKFDLSTALTPQTRQRLEHLEGRFRDLLKKLAELQKQVDSSFARFVKLVRKTRKAKAASSSRGTRKKTSSKAKKKTARKTTKRKAN